MTLRVAVTGITGDVGRGAVQGLKQNPFHEEPIWILGLDASADARSNVLIDSFVQLPPVSDAHYVDALAGTLRINKIDILLPGVDTEIWVLSHARQRLAATGSKVVLAPPELVEAARDKLLTARYLESVGIQVPPTYEAETAEMEDLKYPMIAKPRVGHGSRGIEFLADREAMQRFLCRQPPQYCVQRYIGGPEITVGFLYDSQGVMRDAIAMERFLEGGRTTRARTIEPPVILQFIENFGAKVRGSGAVNAQLRIDPREGPLVFEINARLSGS
ncbi:MAG: ATP-grasp domain-containing protein, partial [Acidobacteriaceae bacterium]|nr:ATP-grasp domain-containing protein [Acidobacteriaceae bacterium]